MVNNIQDMDKIEIKRKYSMSMQEIMILESQGF